MKMFLGHYLKHYIWKYIIKLGMWDTSLKVGHHVSLLMTSD